MRKMRALMASDLLLALCIVGVFVVGSLPGIQSIQEGVAIARAGVIADAAEQYHLAHQAWPTNVEQLTEPDQQNGGAGWVERALVRSPWGKPYQMELPKDEKSKVRVYTETPGGKVISFQRLRPEEEFSPE